MRRRQHRIAAVALSILAAAFGSTALRNRARRSMTERRVPASPVEPVAAAEAAREAVEEPPDSQRRALTLLGAAAALLLIAGVATVIQAPTGASAGTVSGASTLSPLPAPEAGTESAEPAGAPAPLDPPVKLDAPLLGVAAAVDPLGLNPDGTMEVPSDYAKTGWFTGLEAPGQVGTAVIVGHYDSRTGPAVFFRLREFGGGSEFVVTLASGAAKTFVVDRVATYPKEKFPAIEVYGPSDKSSLRLITCGGSFDNKRRTYRDNVVVYATEKERV